jgi:hypothetical protein
LCYGRNYKILWKPYPNGHSIEVFRCFATEELDGSCNLQLRLVTEDYARSVPVAGNEDSDWTSTTVWENYVHCILSSVDWGNPGLKIADSTKDFNTDVLVHQTFRADTLTSSEDDIESHAFGIYLLGHDSCANHTINFTRNDDGSFNIAWSGNIALSYAGNNEYAYSFEAHIKNAEFEGVIPRTEVPSFVFSANS